MLSSEISNDVLFDILKVGCTVEQNVQALCDKDALCVQIECRSKKRKKTGRKGNRKAKVRGAQK